MARALPYSSKFWLYDRVLLLCLQFPIKYTPCFSLTIELCPCGFTRRFQVCVPSSWPCKWMSYLIIHRSSFLCKNAPSMRDTSPRHWKLRKVNHVLPQYLFNHRSCPTAIECLYQTRCSKFIMFPCIPTQDVVWRHHRAVVDRVAPLESDRPIHTTNRVIDRLDHTIGHKTDKLYKLLQRLRESSFQSS
jgi:hypothetical protein